MADIAEEYRSSLSELNFNSKPHINMLTMLAEENAAHAPVIVQAIVDHINSVTPDVKLPSLYLVDSIVKNIGKVYIPLFSKHLVSLFTSVFEKVDENIRSLLYKLRSTWTGIFPNTILLHLDRRVVCLDPAWPILAHPPSIHVNPKFLPTALDKPSIQLTKKTESEALLQEVEMKKKQLMQVLHQKKQELLQLKLKATLTAPAAVESVKVDAKKTANSRDPRLRLSKKVPAVSAGSDSTVLQSVVVIPKGNVNKKSDKDSTLATSKKIKLDDAANRSKKDTKNKTSSGSVGLESSSKLNVDPRIQSNTAKPLQTFNVEKNGRGKKRPYSSEGSVESHAELDKNNKLPPTTIEYKSESEGSLQKKMGSSLEKPNELLQKLESQNHFVPNVTVTDENKYQYKSQSHSEEMFSKNVKKLEPPPPPPLFLGNEDKDYRILPKTIDERKQNESTYSKSRYIACNNRNANRNLHQYIKKGMTVPVVKSFLLDKKERKVYFVNHRSFAFMDDNIPKELTFRGPPKLVFVEGLPQPVELAFGQEIKFEIDGECNFIKFGTPSREIYINDYPYEAQFGGPPFTAVLTNGKIHAVQISGPPPEVVLSESPAHELYERFCLNNQEFLRKFDDDRNINNNVSSNVHIGTQDVDMRVNNVKFSSTFFNFPLERMHDVDWQRVHVGDSQQTEWNVPKNSFETFKDVQRNFVTHRHYPEGPEWNSSQPLSEMQTAPMKPPPLPPKQIINRFPGMPPPTSTTSFGPSYRGGNRPLLEFPTNENSRPVPFSHPGHNSNEFPLVRPEINSLTNFTIPRLPPPPLPPFLGAPPNTSCLTSALPMSTSTLYNNTTVSAPLPLPHTSAPPPNMPPLLSSTRLAAPMPVTNFAATPQIPSYPAPVNMPDLSTPPPSTAITSTTRHMQLFMEKLKAAGLIGSNSSSTPLSTATASSESEKKEDKKEELPKEETIPEITFDSKCLKEFHSGVIAAIYSGSQCATCGMRFKEIQSEQYSGHLDWHFRRNRREKDGAKKPFSRRWYYEIKDWIEFKEFEHVDERAPSYFELQANNEQTEEIQENVCSVSCSESDSEKCAVCGEQFQLFWIEEEEEWHLRNAVKHDDQVYHPACYEDFKKANESVTTDLDTSIDELAIDMKPDAEEFDLDVKVKAEVMDLHVKEEVMDLDVKEEVVDLGAKEEGMDLCAKEEVLDLDAKEGMDLDAKEEGMDLDAEEEGIDLDAKEDGVDLDAKEDGMDLDIRRKIDLDEKEKVDIDIKEMMNVNIKVEKQVIDDDVKKDVEEMNISVKKEIEKVEYDVKTDLNEKIVQEAGTQFTEPVSPPKEDEEKEVKVEVQTTECVIKEEPVKAEVESEKKHENSEMDTVNLEKSDGVSSVDSEKTNEQSQSSSQIEKVPICVKSEEESEDIEFRPPTPDPRFEVLPPVFKGTEISNLCTIM